MILEKSPYFMIRHVIVGDFGGTRCFPGVTPVDKLLFEQSGFIVLSQSSKDCPVRPTLTFPTTQVYRNDYLSSSTTEVSFNAATSAISPTHLIHAVQSIMHTP